MGPIFLKIGIKSASLSSFGNLFCSKEELMISVSTGREVLIDPLSKFTGISPCLVAFLLLRLNISFLSSFDDMG